MPDIIYIYAHIPKPIRRRLTTPSRINGRLHSFQARESSYSLDKRSVALTDAVASCIPDWPACRWPSEEYVFASIFA